MDNRELAMALLEQAMTLLEYSNHGEKGMTGINQLKHDANAVKQDRDELGETKLGRLALKLNDKNIDKALNGNTKLLERIGKNARTLQARSTKEKSTYIDDIYSGDKDYDSFKKGLMDKTPIKDKDKMRKQNIKLGYQIAQNSKKARNLQNESISELLTEAALLLTESVGVKDKSTDKVVKVFKDNKEATDWIIANGGNEKYRLTNELK